MNVRESGFRIAILVLQRYAWLLLLFLCRENLAQIGRDSLQQLLKNRESDTARVNLLCSLSKASSGDISYQYATEALQLAEKTGYLKGLAEAHCLLGKYYYFKEKFSPSLLHCSMALRYARAIPDYHLAALSCLYIGYNHYHNEPKISLEYYQSCIRYSKKAHDPVMESYAYSAIGNVHERWDDGTGALGYFLLSLKIRRSMGTMDEVISSLIETARAYNRTGMLDKSDETVRQALSLAEMKGSNDQNLVYLYQMRGYHFFDRKKDYKQALDYFKKAYELVKRNGWYDKNNVTSLRPLAETYYQLGDLKNASEFYRLYFQLFETEQKKIDKQLFDSQFLIQQENEKQKFFLKDAEILKQKIRIQESEQQAAIFIFGLVLLLIITFFIYRSSRLKEQSVKQLDGYVKERTKDLADTNQRLQAEIIEKNNTKEKLKASEQKLTEINKELESFIYKASHDLKGPLSSARGLINLALTEESESEKEQLLKLIRQSLDRLDAILLDLQELTFIRQGKLVYTRIDPVQLIHHLLPNFSGYENFNNISFQVNNELGREFYTDAILLNSVMRNVLENAVKYSKKSANSFVNIRFSEKEGYYVITVSDNGIGISPEFHAKIFDVFFRANDVTKGSGLGLYIVKNAMDKLQGKVELARSQLREGTTINLYFPLREAGGLAQAV